MFLHTGHYFKLRSSSPANQLFPSRERGETTLYTDVGGDGSVDDDDEDLWKQKGARMVVLVEVECNRDSNKCLTNLRL